MSSNSINNSTKNSFDNDTNQLISINNINSNNITNNHINNVITSCSNNINNNGLSINSSIPECKVWKNPMSLFRGAEYSKLTLENTREPLTFYDMNLSAQDHQTYFTCDSDEGKPEYEIMQRAWRERNPSTRISLANEALSKNPECTPALILLAEEESQTILEVEQVFKQALKHAEAAYKKSLQAQEQGHNLENVHSMLKNCLFFILIFAID